ncbi:hypothetical protein Bca101_029166 [Brassica carinata]
MEEITTRDESSRIAANGQRLLPSGGISADGPPTTLSGTGIDRMAFLHANNTKFVNGAVVGERNVFQVDQRLGIGSKFPFFNRRHQLTLTRFIQLQQVEEGAGKPPPPVLVLHGHYGGCVGDLPSYEAFCSWRSILCPWLQHGGARCGQKHPRGKTGNTRQNISLIFFCFMDCSLVLRLEYL